MCTQGLATDDAGAGSNSNVTNGGGSAPSAVPRPAPRTVPCTPKGSKAQLTFSIYFPLPPYPEGTQFNALRAGAHGFNFTVGALTAAVHAHAHGV